MKWDNSLYKFFRKPKCDVDCSYLHMFGFAGACDARDDGWGSFHESVEPGQRCLYTKKKDLCLPDLVVTVPGFWAAM